MILVTCFPAPTAGYHFLLVLVIENDNLLVVLIGFKLMAILFASFILVNHTNVYMNIALYFFFSCRFDFVELTDNLGQRIARLNGSRSGFTVTVGSDRTQLLRIRFFSDFIVVRQGFLAQYNITVGEYDYVCSS